MIGGTQKGGTTTLDACLRHHPAIRMGLRKELHYFDDDQAFVAAPDYVAYHRMLDGRVIGGVPLPLYGDATPTYMWWRTAAGRIKAYNPGMKWIILLRNPVERAYSQWNMATIRGREQLLFMDALLAEEGRLALKHPRQSRAHSYLDRGRYVEQLDRVWAEFGRERTLVLLTDELKRDLQAAFDRVCGFLGVTQMNLPASFRNRHVLPYREPMSEQARAWMLERLAPEIIELEDRLDCSLGHWMTKG